MLNLPDVTVCAIDCVTPQLAARAIERSQQQCRFARALLMSDTRVPTTAQHITIPKLDSRESYSRFILAHLADHIDTPFVLIVQWDGFVTNADSWDPRFLDYDYIGAPWSYEDEHRVGNGGFSLRSQRILAACRTLPIVDELEDIYICRDVRPLLEQQHQIRFAPVEVAQRFSYEHPAPPFPAFGFHGMHNLPSVVGHAEFQAIIAELNRDKIQVQAATHTIVQLLLGGGWDAARAVYRLVRDEPHQQLFLKTLVQFCGSAPAAQSVLQVLSSES